MPKVVKANERSKALIATLFAMSAIVSAKTYAADNEVQALSATQQLVDSTLDDRFTKAYKLVELANAYLCVSDSKMAERCVARVQSGWKPSDTGRGNAVTFLSNRISLRQSELEKGQRPQSVNMALADDALTHSLKQIEAIPEFSRRLKLYFIASMLFKEAGNEKQYRRCKKIVDENITACSNHSSADEKQIGAVVFVLNSMAYGLVPFAVGDIQGGFVDGRINKNGRRSDEDFIGPINQQSYKSAEILRLKGLAVVDQLDTKSDIRRKAHRDMVIWYRGLGNSDLAEIQKQTLFELVGFKDDGLLYPQVTDSCGSEVWWQPKIVSEIQRFCGMG